MTRTRWRRAAVGMALAAPALSVGACGDDVVDDDVEQHIAEGVAGDG